MQDKVLKQGDSRDGQYSGREHPIGAGTPGVKSFIYGLFLVLGALAFRLATSPAWQQAVSDGAIWLLKPILVPLVLAIAAPAFVYVVSFLILLSALVACAIYWILQVRPRQAQLKAVLQGLRGLPRPVSGRGQQSSAAMQGLGALLRGNAVFVSAWSEYQAQALRSGRMPAAPFSHFVASEPEDRRRGGFMQSLPGYFTSVGLIFTFMGLVVALYFAAKGFRSGNIDEARSAIIALLNAASFKFLTSVAALLGALVISLFLRFNLAGLARRSQNLVEHVEAFLTLWREHAMASGGWADAPDSALQARLELLIDRIERLTGAVEILARRDRPRLVETDNASHG